MATAKVDISTSGNDKNDYEISDNESTDSLGTEGNIDDAETDHISTIKDLLEEDGQCSKMIKTAKQFSESLLFTYTDFTNELNPTNPCLISGDSLFFEIVGCKLLNWQWGGQSLPIIYLIEKCVDNFRDFGGCTQIVWFKDMERLYAENWQIYFMYTIIKKHTISTLKACEIDNPFCKQWYSLLDNTRPPVILVSPTSASTKVFYNKNFDKFNACFSCIAFAVLMKGVSVVAIFSLQKCLSRVLGFFAKPLIKLGKYENFFQATWRATVGEIKTISPIQCPAYNTADNFWCEIIMKMRTCTEFQTIEFVKFAQMFAVYLVCLKSMPVKCRSFTTEQHLCYKFAISIHEKFLPKFLTLAAASISNARLLFEIVDFYDGKLFHKICCEFPTLISVIDNHILTECQTLCNNIDLPFEDLQILSRGSSVQVIHQPLIPDDENIQRNIDFGQGFIQSFLINNSLEGMNSPSIRLSLTDLNFLMKNFFDKYHWHSGKLLSDDFGNKNQPTTKSNAKLKTWLQFYGTCIEGLERIHKIAKKFKETNDDIGSMTTGIKTGEKQKPKSKKEQIKEENSANIRREKVADERLKIDNVMNNELKKATPEMFLMKINRKLKETEYSENKVYLLKTKMKRILEIFNTTNQLTDEEKQTTAFHIVDCIKQIDKNFKYLLTAEDTSFVNEVFVSFGFSFPLYPTCQLPEKMQKSSAIKMQKYCSINIDFYDFQLKYCGEAFEIQTKPMVDDRVEFIPDAWQIKLLNTVDENQSALIVAPTSAGKTFISYYCIDKVLKQSDGIVIYVAPTKALVNQVAATIYTRFSRYCVNKNEAVFGVFTRDYSYDIMNSRVLITVPQCFEILLLSTECKSWREKIRYVIFDEIHCIGGGIGDIKGSEIWEHIILMVNCPYLALSATVANPELLLQWLSAAEAAKMSNDERNNKLRKIGVNSYKVNLITFNERFAELDLFLFDHSTKLLETLHPFAALNMDTITTNGFPTDMNMTSLQTYQLYSEMTKRDKEIKSPSEFFQTQNIVWIERKHLREYEVYLKSVFLSWITADVTDATALDSSKAKATIDKFKDNTNCDGFKKQMAPSYSKEDLCKNIVPLVEKLNEENKLPCLIFSDNRLLCEVLANTILSYLRKAQKEYYQKPENRAILKIQEKNIEHDKMKQKLLKNKVPIKKEQTKKLEKKSKELSQENYDDTASSEVTINQQEFSFCNKQKKSAVDFEKVIDRLRWKDKNTPSTKHFIELLTRGIGYHHSGLTTAKRQSVEILFKTGALNVVFSTSTLALGINMPCRTVVFCYDSLYLTPLQFRQMSGRAGRRGYDDKGYIIFYGIPPQKISRLICSNLPALKGNAPFGVSFILRLIILTTPTEVERASPTEMTTQLEKKLIAQCLICLKNNLFAENMSHHAKSIFLYQMDFYVKFSFSILQMLNLIDDAGFPIGLAGVVSHLHYHEPGSFIFVYFVQNGLFHDLYETYIPKGRKLSGNETMSMCEEKLFKKIIRILCAIFTHKQLPHGYTEGKTFISSKVVLKPLPDNFYNALKKYNSTVESLYRETMKYTNNHQTAESTYILPVSQITVTKSEIEIQWEILKQFFNPVSTTFQNPFISICGNPDREISFLNTNFFSAINEGLSFDQSFLPSKACPLIDEQGNVISLNAYPLDFFRHGNRTAIIKDNQLFEGDVYSLLKDFMLMISAISVVLDEVTVNFDDPVAAAFRKLDAIYKAKFYKAFPN